MRTLRIAFLSALVLELVATLSVALVAVPGRHPAALRRGSTWQTALLVLMLAPEAYLPLRRSGPGSTPAWRGSPRWTRR